MPLDDVRICCYGELPEGSINGLRDTLTAVCVPGVPPRRFGFEVLGILIDSAVLTVCEVARRRASLGVHLRTDLVFQPHKNYVFGIDALAAIRTVAMLPNCFVVVQCEMFTQECRFAGRIDRSMHLAWIPEFREIIE